MQYKKSPTGRVIAAPPPQYVPRTPEGTAALRKFAESRKHLFPHLDLSGHEARIVAVMEN